MSATWDWETASVEPVLPKGLPSSARGHASAAWHFAAQGHAIANGVIRHADDLARVGTECGGDAASADVPSWKTIRDSTLVQYTGRLHRLHPGKRDIRIFDYVDREVPMLLRMFEKRLRGYRAIGYARGEAPLWYAEPADETTVEYDEDVLAELGRNDDLA